MAKSKVLYICKACGYTSPRWTGKCPSCEEWNTFEEEAVTISKPVMQKGAAGVAAHAQKASEVFTLSQVEENDEQRLKTGLAELNRVLGGGIVKGSLILLGGEPGIGKSTLLLQICEHIGAETSVLYISGEESCRQIKLRANRLGVETEELYLLSETNVENVISTILVQKPGLVIVDSIQTMMLPNVASSTGSITQVRECTNALMRCAKDEEVPIIVVGHVNKDGAIAGPKVLEHIVDAVLYFEGDRHQNYRILRSAKNRFGSTNEIGVFDMTDKGLEEVENPSQMMLSGRSSNVSGTCITSVLEGTRPILAEVQALVAKSGFSVPRRTSTGFDFNRMAIMLAVLEKRAGYHFGSLDAYVNVAGGLRLAEPSADLAVLLSLVSSLLDIAIPDHLVAFGEVGLAGEIRSVNHPELRIREAERLGFETCILPQISLKRLDAKQFLGIQLLGVRSTTEAIQALKQKI